MREVRKASKILVGKPEGRPNTIYDL